MDGVLVIDKPEGPTSHDIVAAVRRTLGEKRVGHTGTLDPLATGVLALACGRATRLARFLTAADKTYDASIVFGVTTDTLDVTGAETSRSGTTPSNRALEQALAALTGDYLQMPPAHSAKKVGGRRAYELARRHEVVTLAPVPVHVSRLEVLAFEHDRCRLSLTCSAGFYVRALVRDLGERCGTGACLEALRRTRSGDFPVEEALGFEAIAQAADLETLLIPMHRLLPGFPAVTVTSEGLARVSHGQSIRACDVVDPPPVEPEGWVRVLDGEGMLVALGTARETPAFLHPDVVLI